MSDETRDIDAIQRAYEGAVESGQLAKAELLLEAGAKHSAVGLIAFGKIPELRETLSENPDLVHELTVNGNPMLFVAAGTSQLEAAQLLLDHGADAHALSTDGQNILYQAKIALSPSNFEYDCIARRGRAETAWSTSAFRVGSS